MSVVENDTEEPKTKRVRHSESESESESEREGNEDRLSDLPDCLLLHILSFAKCKDAVRTCILSRRWKPLWKRLPTLILHSSEFRNLKIFSKFVSKVLSLRDDSIALRTLDFKRSHRVEPHLLKRVLSYASSHNVQCLGIKVDCHIDQLPPCIFSCQTLTSLKLSVYCGRGTLFPRSLNLAALTSLHLSHFAFCASENDQAEPFSTCNRLNNLAIDNCTLRDAPILCISSTTLVNFTMHSNHPKQFYKIVLSTPNLRSFAFTGIPYQQLSKNNLSSLEQVSIDAEIWSRPSESPLILLNWLIELANVQSLSVTTNTLQVLFLIPGLLKMKLPCLGNLKSLKVILKPLSNAFASKLGVAKPWKTKLKLSSLVVDGIVDFLLQNSPSAEVSLINC